MEFPTLGEHCQFENCNQTDFLPLQCKCGNIYCREHFLEHCLSGTCKLAPEPKEVKLKTDDRIFKCSENGCRKGSFHEMLCAKCHKHYCIDHRFHPSCPEIDDETLAFKREQREAPKREFNEANKHLEAKITENIRKALQSSAKVKTATKIHFMRVKQKALGPKIVPAGDRIYFAIIKPDSTGSKPVKIVQEVNGISAIKNVTLDPNLQDTIPLFVSLKWSLGRAIDVICDLCKIVNDNNKIGNTKLRLFRHLDGYCISPAKMDTALSELVKLGVLNQGDKLVLDYVANEDLDGLKETSQLFLSTINI